MIERRRPPVETPRELDAFERAVVYAMQRAAAKRQRAERRATLRVVRDGGESA